jgi:chromosome segregation ATPase
MGKRLDNASADIGAFDTAPDVRLVRACSALPLLEGFAKSLRSCAAEAEEQASTLAEIIADIDFDLHFVRARWARRVAAWKALQDVLLAEEGTIEGTIQHLRVLLQRAEKDLERCEHYLASRREEHLRAQQEVISCCGQLEANKRGWKAVLDNLNAEVVTARRPIFKKLNAMLKRLSRRGALGYLQMIFENQISAHPDYVARVERLRGALTSIVVGAHAGEKKRIEGLSGLLRPLWTNTLIAGVRRG